MCACTPIMYVGKQKDVVCKQCEELLVAGAKALQSGLEVQLVSDTF